MLVRALDQRTFNLIDREAKSRGQTITEEMLNSATHGIGVLLALTGGTFLITLAALDGNPWKLAGVSIYAACLVLLYLASALYHGIQHGIIKSYLRIFDHCSIYLLIAGTYTPFLIVTLREPLGWSLFVVVWGLALSGIAFKVIYPRRFENLHLLNYLATGWVILLAHNHLEDYFSDFGLTMLIAGGACYTAGVFIFLLDRLPYLHTVWHLFALGGSTFHYFAVFAEVF